MSFVHSGLALSDLPGSWSAAVSRPPLLLDARDDQTPELKTNEANDCDHTTQEEQHREASRILRLQPRT
jgi:hypothetical protein